jgi:hypothetical protein
MGYALNFTPIYYFKNLESVVPKLRHMFSETKYQIP